MILLKDSKRIKNIENRFSSRIEDLFYQMYWVEGMRHRDIGAIINIPRVTITRWFDYLGIPAQSCRRFTDRNLISWYYKTGKLRKKSRYKGPDLRIQRTKGGLNVDFFKKWSLEMAYVLGYFCADGCMYENPGGSKYINFVSTDYEILKKIKKLLSSTHRIIPKTQSEPNWKSTFWLQIGCKEIYEDIIKMGLIPKKEFRLRLPKVPLKYFRDFVRGFFDGDGCVSYGLYKRKHRKSKVFILMSRFTSSSKNFLECLKERLKLESSLRGGCVSAGGGCYCLTYSKEDSKKLFKYMYKGVGSDYYLERKYNKFQKAFKIMGTLPSLV